MITYRRSARPRPVIGQSHIREAEANDAEIQVIRKNLDGVLDPVTVAKADELKRSFVKVYLARG